MQKLFKEKPYFLTVYFFASLTLIGLFNEWLSCLAGAVLLIYLALSKDKIRFNLSPLALFGAILILGYLVTVIWAVDRGFALIGFFKFLPVFLFAVCLLNNYDAKRQIKAVLPVFAAFMTVISAVLMQIPALKNYFSVANRLAGFFEYSNTFAMFLLVAELLVLSKDLKNIKRIILLAVLLFGIFYSGSRAVFVLLLLSNAVVLYKKATRKKAVLIVAACVAAAFVAVLLIANIGTSNPFARFLTINLKSSTFVGRLLYWYDAFPYALKHPFGTGFLGYYSAERSFQTGIYSVKYIHNDLLQIMLDIGIIPALSFLTAVVLTVIKKDGDFFEKVILITFFLHSLFDFDLQFTAVFMLFLLFISNENKKEYYLPKKRTGYNLLFCAVSVLAVYMSLSSGLAFFGIYELSDRLYPYNTEVKTALLQKEEDPARMNTVADQIISINDYSAIAYSAKSHYAYSEGDLMAFVNHKQKVFTLAPFDSNEYEEYCYMLINAINAYNKAGDRESANILISKLKEVPAIYEQNLSKLSKLGKMIKDQPEPKLSDEILYYIETYTKSKP